MYEPNRNLYTVLEETYTEIFLRALSIIAEARNHPNIYQHNYRSTNVNATEYDKTIKVEFVYSYTKY